MTCQSPRARTTGASDASATYLFGKFQKPLRSSTFDPSTSHISHLSHLSVLKARGDRAYLFQPPELSVATVRETAHDLILQQVLGAK